jgi:2-polyprenyl-6-methoxyphenol hydroxylase-like FAD-dependent oxidoreductase
MAPRIDHTVAGSCKGGAMATIVVCGAGPVGLGAAMLLAGDGHRVTVVERDAAPPPAPPDAFGQWRRPGVGQFQQPHTLHPRARLILDQDLPGVVDRLTAAGCVWVDYLALIPPLVRDRSPREGDDRFRIVTGRRPTVEAVLAAAAQDRGIDIRRGVSVAGLLTGPSVVDGAPHATGVRTSDGEDLDADLVVDAMGRRTKLAEWIEAAGGRPPHTEAEDCGFVYYSRYFRGPEVPAFVGPPVVDLGTISVLTIPGDNGTWSVTVFAAASDTALRSLRDPDRFDAVVRACPLQAPWLDGEPLTDVLTTAGVLDRYRRFVVNGKPVATGVAAVGDAWACTNPSAGRGITVGMLHAQRLRDTVRSCIDDPAAFAHAWDHATEADVSPFYWNQIKADRQRIAEMDALRAGGEPPAPDPEARTMAAAMLRDPDVFRGMLEIGGCLALPEEVFARPGFMDKVQAHAGGRTWDPPGPDRQALLELVRGPAAAG